VDDASTSVVKSQRDRFCGLQVLGSALAVAIVLHEVEAELLGLDEERMPASKAIGAAYSQSTADPAKSVVVPRLGAGDAPDDVSHIIRH
jgi:hypothetical protein